MKIGILTFHRAINYGAVLQCYALYTTLNGMGHDVEVVDYRPAYIEKYRKLHDLSSKKNIFSAIRIMLRSLMLYKGRRMAVERFDSFLKLLSLSPIVCEAKDVIAQGYDIIISGSDQIWNRKITAGQYDKFYWGQFKHPNTKFASYAASFGEISKSPELESDLKAMLPQVDAIGVREKDFAAYINDLGLKANVCVDPTILVDEQAFHDLAEDPDSDDYILVYALKDRAKVVEWAKKMRQKENLKIVVLGGNVSYKTDFGKDIEVIQGVSPRLFLGYFKKARYVVNASFHGTVFSTLFRKNFYSLEVGNSGRYRQYLDSVGLSNRFVQYQSEPSFAPVDYSNFESNKKKLVSSSLEYLHELGI